MSRFIESNPGPSARIIGSSVRTGILLLAVSAAALAQVYPGGGYPGGGYPGGGYPGGGYPGQTPYPGGRNPTGIPVPGRTGKTSKTPAPNQNGPLPNFRGSLKVFDEKAISVELGDKRVMDFRRTDKTKFFKAGDEVKTPKFNLGDQVSVEAMEDPGGNSMTAVNVYWEKGGGPTTSSKNDDGVVDTWKDDPKPGSEHGTAKSSPASAGAEDSGPPRLQRPTATEAAAPISRDPDDPGPPKLKRGGVADPARQKAQNVPEQTAPVQSASARIPTTPERWKNELQMVRVLR